MDTCFYARSYRLNGLSSFLKTASVEFCGRRRYERAMLLEQNLKLSDFLNSHHSFPVEPPRSEFGLTGEVDRCSGKHSQGYNGNSGEKVKFGCNAVTNQGPKAGEHLRDFPSCLVLPFGETLRWLLRRSAMDHPN
jgi:hypothetical protein